MPDKHFRKIKEDFICGHCGAAVQGDGYTNHCPVCLWSSHVDVHPGDRAADCGALMRPLSLRVEKGEYVITHQCIRCGHRKPNKSARNDNPDVLIELSKNRRS